MENETSVESNRYVIILLFDFVKITKKKKPSVQNLKCISRFNTGSNFKILSDVIIPFIRNQLMDLIDQFKLIVSDHNTTDKSTFVCTHFISFGCIPSYYTTAASEIAYYFDRLFILWKCWKVHLKLHKETLLFIVHWSHIFKTWWVLHWLQSPICLHLHRFTILYVLQECNLIPHTIFSLLW